MKWNTILIFAWTFIAGMILPFHFSYAQKSDQKISWNLYKATDPVQHPDQISAEWKTVEKKRIREGFNPNPTWLKLEFVNPEKDSVTYYWVIANTYIDTVDYWINGQHIAQTGLSFPFAQRPMEAEYFVLPLKTAAGESVQLYTRLGVKTGSLTSALFLFDKNGLDNWISSENLFNAVYLGLIINVFLIALVVSLVSRRNIMIWYAIYLASFIIFQLQTLGYAYRYLWPDFPFVAFLGKGILQLFTCFLFWLFCAEIIRYSKLSNLISAKFRKALLLYLPLNILAAFALNAMGSYTAIYYLVVVCSFVYLLTGFIDLLICVLNKFRPAYGVFAAIFFPVFASTLVILRAGNVLPNWSFIDNAYPISFLAEMLLILIFTVYFLRRQSQYHTLQDTRFSYHRRYLKKLLPEMKELTTRAEVQRALSEEFRNELMYRAGNGTIKEDADDVLWDELANRNEAQQDSNGVNYPPELLEKDFSILSALLLSKKLYTNPELSLQLLAKEAGIPFSRASRCINAQAKKNFSEWLNEFRVEEAKKLLQSSASEKYSVEGIAQMAGFGSRSNFYSVFKRFTNLSPVDYKNMMQGKNLV